MPYVMFVRTIMISDIRAISLWAITFGCDRALSTTPFSPELGMLMAESLLRGSGAEALSYAHFRNRADRDFIVNGSADRSHAEPIDFANRLNAMLGIFTSHRVYDFDEAIERFNTTCIDPDNVTGYYRVADLSSLGMAQAGILSAFMSMRAQVCGYTSEQIRAFVVSRVQVAKEQVEQDYGTGPAPVPDVIRCWLQRLSFAIRRLGESTDPLVMGFLTMDTCLPGLHTPYIIERDVTVAVSEPLNYFDPGMVDLTYPARADYQTGNYSRGAWFINPPENAAYASVWFHLMSGNGNANSTIDLFSIQDTFKLSFKRYYGRDKLLISGTCGEVSTTQVDFTHTRGWHFVSAAIHGSTMTIRYDDSYWYVRAPLSTGCGDRSASLGPRLDAPWDGRQPERATIRFYDFKVSDNPTTTEDISITKEHLTDLGKDTPVACNPRNANERRVGLKACYPGPVVRVQYVYDSPTAPVAAPDLGMKPEPVDGVYADIPVTVEGASLSVPVTDSLALGEREFLIITGLGLISCFLIVGVYVWYLHRSFKRQLHLLNKQLQELVKLTESIEASSADGSPAQASASGGL
jgi:hypothetical protein